MGAKGRKAKGGDGTTLRVRETTKERLKAYRGKDTLTSRRESFDHLLNRFLDEREAPQEART